MQSGWLCGNGGKGGGGRGGGCVEPHGNRCWGWVLAEIYTSRVYRDVHLACISRRVFARDIHQQIYAEIYARFSPRCTPAFTNTGREGGREGWPVLS